jgi:rare lipoprotein A
MALGHKSIFLLLLLSLFTLFLASCGVVKRAETDDERIRIVGNGIASWYGPQFHGQSTANGETYNMNEYTAAHRTLPFNTLVRVENQDNGKSVVVRINDRGPYVGNRIIDLSRRAASEIDMIGPGTAEVLLYLIEEGDRPITSQNISSRETFTIQIASFPREADAQNEASGISGSRVERSQIGSNTVYRVYYGSYDSIDDAHRARERLLQNGIQGFVKQMEN